MAIMETAKQKIDQLGRTIWGKSYWRIASQLEVCWDLENDNSFILLMWELKYPLTTKNEFFNSKKGKNT